MTVGTANRVGNVTTVGLTLSSTFDKSFTFTLSTLSDTLVEGSESFTVAASNAAASNGASATASGSVITTITDNDTLALSLTGDPTVAEGGAPSYTLAITSGDIPAGSTATVDLSITLLGGLTGAEAADFVKIVPEGSSGRGRDRGDGWNGQYGWQRHHGWSDAVLDV